MNVKKLIFEGEGVTLDFKKTITSCEKIARTMVSFANNKGGRLLIGVADDGTIKGVKSEDEERYMITKAAHLYAKPALEPIFEEVYIDDKLVLVVDTPESLVKPHFALADDGKHHNLGYEVRPHEGSLWLHDIAEGCDLDDKNSLH